MLIKQINYVVFNRSRAVTFAGSAER